MLFQKSPRINYTKQQDCTGRNESCMLTTSDKEYVINIAMVETTNLKPDLLA